MLTKAKKLASNVSTFDLAGKLKSGMNTILTNSSRLKEVLHKNVSALDEMWTGWKQQVKQEVKKTADQVMDQVSDTMTRLKNSLSGPQKHWMAPLMFHSANRIILFHKIASSRISGVRWRQAKRN
ncbi:hypothetical protein NST07_10615 [Paenibacillus sp. FSL L8-0340]|uniref:hypothetical protein n=1 Tax=Paenibacillus sp. FSL L8-0340 TaxID=2954685 RepID=UPI003158E1A1